MEPNKIYIAHDIGKTELTPEQAKELLKEELPAGMKKIIEGVRKMSKLEEIKERNKRRNNLMIARKDEYSMMREVEYQGLVTGSVKDVEYLLSRIEIADKALELTIKELDGMWLDDDIGLLQSQVDNLNKSKEALQQLRQ